LERTDAHVIVCGRSHAKTQAFINELPAWTGRVSIALLDRERASAADVAMLNAFCVVDAAGPFQGQTPDFARAVIEAGAHYVDLADARDFVAAFPALDEAAKARDVLAVTGASSTPALSHAVIDELTRGWTQIDDVEIGLSPGGQAQLGLSVVKAILSYAGRPVRVWLHGRWATAPGWSMTIRRRMCDFGRRLLSLVETPDLDLIPSRFPSMRNAVFRAGVELWVLHLGLWVLSYLVRFRVMKSLVPLAEPLNDIASALRRFGSDCGGMVVEVTGVYGDGTRLRATWTLVAESGDGPRVPTVPALCVVRALLDGGLAQRGATACVGLVALSDIEAEFKRFAIRTDRESRVLERAPLFRRVLANFDAMPEVVRASHAPDPAHDHAGELDVEGAANPFGGLIARLMGFPRAATALPASVTIEREGDGEVWIRRFGDTTFASHVSAGADGALIERFGPFAFDLDAHADAGGFDLSIRRAHLFGMPLPGFLTPSTRARAFVDEQGRYRFDVEITLPLAGRLVRYRGWLSPAH
jgi:saccharopine dehydrogenase-like NADP-dependent oxidoreductase